jgi:predicted RecB family nuclease
MRETIPTIATLATINPEGFIKGKRTVFPGMGADRLRRLQARAIMLKGSPPKPYLREPVSLRVVPLELFFDVEVDPLRGICYLHGFIERYNGDNATERFVHFLAEELTPESERDAFESALDYLAAQADAAIYYYSKYERTTYRRLQQKYADICTAEHATYLGFAWRDTHPSGAASVEWFDRWCRDRKPEMRQRILDYNEDDCRATRVLLDGIRSLAD